MASTEAEPEGGTVIPTIYLNTPDRDATVQTLRNACKSTGFFYLDGHGISPSLLRSVFDHSMALFALPVEEKRALSDPVLSRGYTAMEEETLDPIHQKSRGDTKEGFYIGKHVPKDSPKYNPAKLAGENQWPSPTVTPSWSLEYCNEWRSVMELYHEEASRIAFRLVQLIALAIGLDDEHYFDECFTDNMASIRLLHYDEVESRPDEGIFACGAHSDYGMLTLLLTDATPGLQILKDRRWVSVPPKRDVFVVNLGDMLERWTNGSFKSTMHRVLTLSKNTDRYSIPFFYEPNFDTIVQCLDICCLDNEVVKYSPTTSGQHLLDRYKATHADFKPHE